MGDTNTHPTAGETKKEDKKNTVKPKYANVKGRSTKAEMAREKATAEVIQLWATGHTLDQTIEMTGLTFSTVCRIRNDHLTPEFIELFNRAKTNEVSHLIEEGLKANLIATTNIVKVTNDEAWIKSQRAPELATFFGVISDKTVRILAAIERANERQDSRRFETVPETGTSPLEELQTT